MRSPLRACVLVSLALTFSLGAVGTAHAQSGNGANVINETECFEVPGFGVTCITTKSVNKITETPSGVTSAFTNSKSSSESNQAGCRASETSEFHGHDVFKDGVLHESSLAIKGDGTLTCAGQTTTCSTLFHTHYANGKVQFARGGGEPACTTDP